MYKITVVLHDGNSVEAERSTEEGAQFFRQACLDWGVTFDGQIQTPAKIKEVSVVKCEAPSRSTKVSKPRTSRSTRKPTSKGGDTDDS